MLKRAEGEESPSRNSRKYLTCRCTYTEHFEFLLWRQEQGFPFAFWNLVYPHHHPLLLFWRKERRDGIMRQNDKTSRQSRRDGRKVHRSQQFFSRWKQNSFCPRRCGRLLLGNSHLSQQPESSVCKVGSVCLLPQQSHAELLCAVLATSGLGMRAAESCSAISSLLPWREAQLGGTGCPAGPAVA